MPLYIQQNIGGDGTPESQPVRYAWVDQAGNIYPGPGDPPLDQQGYMDPGTGAILPQYTGLIGADNYPQQTPAYNDAVDYGTANSEAEMKQAQLMAMLAAAGAGASIYGAGAAPLAAEAAPVAASGYGAAPGTLAAANAAGATGGDALGALIAGNAENWGVTYAPELLAGGVGAAAATAAGAGAAPAAGTTAATAAGTVAPGLLSKIVNGTATADDFLTLLTKAIPGVIGAVGADKQAEALSKIGEQQNANYQSSLAAYMDAVNRQTSAYNDATGAYKERSAADAAAFGDAKTAYSDTVQRALDAYGYSKGAYEGDIARQNSAFDFAKQAYGDTVDRVEGAYDYSKSAYENEVDRQANAYDYSKSAYENEIARQTGAYDYSKKAFEDKNAFNAALGAPSRARYEGSFAPGFTMENDPGYTDALNQSAKATLAGLSVQGNPAGSPNAWAKSLSDLNEKFAYPALQKYREGNLTSGGYTGAAYQTGAAPTMSQIGSAPNRTQIGAAPTVGSVGATPSLNQAGPAPTISNVGAFPTLQSPRSFPSAPSTPSYPNPPSFSGNLAGIQAGRGVWDAAGSAYSSIFNPQKSLAEQLAEYQKLIKGL